MQHRHTARNNDQRILRMGRSTPALEDTTRLHVHVAAVDDHPIRARSSSQSQGLVIQADTANIQDAGSPNNARARAGRIDRLARGDGVIAQGTHVAGQRQGDANTVRGVRSGSRKQCIRSGILDDDAGETAVVINCRCAEELGAVYRVARATNARFSAIDTHIGIGGATKNTSVVQAQRGTGIAKTGRAPALRTSGASEREDTPRVRSRCSEIYACDFLRAHAAQSQTGKDTNDEQILHEERHPVHICSRHSRAADMADADCADADRRTFRDTKNLDSLNRRELLTTTLTMELTVVKIDCFCNGVASACNRLTTSRLPKRWRSSNGLHRRRTWSERQPAIWPNRAAIWHSGAIYRNGVTR